MTELRVDVAVVGGGPAGIAAAVSAAETGATVMLIDEAPRPGGQIWRHMDEQVLPANARRWLHRLRQSSATVLSGASVFDGAIADSTAGPGCVLGIEQAGAVLHVRSRHVILAVGARELFLPFPGWTLPNVVGVGAAQALLRSGLDVRGRRVLIGGTGPLLLPVAATLAGHGADVAAVLEQAPRSSVLRFGATLWRTPRRLIQAASYRRAFRRAPYLTGAWVVRAEGGASVESAVVTDGTRTGTRSIECDLLCVGYGLVAATGLAEHLGCDMTDNAIVVDSRQRTSVDGVYAVGELTGVAGVDAALVEGSIAGLDAAGAAPARGLMRRRVAGDRFVQQLGRGFALRDELRQLALPDTVLCRCEDVTLDRVLSCGSMREAKLTTRAGMGPCQGRICGPALRHVFDWQADRVRPPVVPVRIGALATRAE